MGEGAVDGVEIADNFEFVLTTLRGLAVPCAPPIGVGEFDVLFASVREVVVWYSPVREGHREGEVAIPCARLAAAWAVLAGGAVLDEAALCELGAGEAGGRWLLALLALLPGARVQPEPLALAWSPPVRSTRGRKRETGQQPIAVKPASKRTVATTTATRTHRAAPSVQPAARRARRAQISPASSGEAATGRRRTII